MRILFYSLIIISISVIFNLAQCEETTGSSAKTKSKKHKVNKKTDDDSKGFQEKDTLYEFMDANKEKLHRLYVSPDEIKYRKMKVDFGVFYMTSPVYEINTDNKRSLMYPEMQTSLEWWQTRNWGAYVDYASGFLPSDSENSGDPLYYPSTANLSIKYKLISDYYAYSPFYNFEIGVHYHDMRYKVKNTELAKRIYKGPYFGVERKISLSPNLGFFFELYYMPYLLSSEYNKEENTKDTSTAIHFLASFYFTIKKRIRDKQTYRLKLFCGFSQRDYFTKIKNSSIDRSQLDQRYSSFFVIASQEL